MATRSATAPKSTKPKSEAAELAALCVKARAELYYAGRALHDQVGPQLSVAGLLLDQLRIDFPATQASVNEVLERLNDAMEHVRQLSQRVNPAPAIRTGLKRALADLAERNPGLQVSFKSTAPQVPGPVIAALYETAAAAVAQAHVAKATRTLIAVTGSSGIHLKISDNGVDRHRDREKALAISRILAAESGIVLTISSKTPASGASRSVGAKLKSGKTPIKALAPQSTIVSIQYASRRSPGG
jgi:signal transduction histidine kinase